MITVVLWNKKSPVDFSTELLSFLVSDDYFSTLISVPSGVSSGLKMSEY